MVCIHQLSGILKHIYAVGQTDTKFLDMCGQTDTKFLDMCGQTDTKILPTEKVETGLKKEERKKERRKVGI